MRKMCCLFISCLHRILTNRARVFMWFILDITHLVVFPFIWLTVYHNRETILGYSPADIVTYYIVTALVVTFASTHSAGYVKKDIMTGKLNEFMVKPLNSLVFHFVNEIAYKASYSIFVIVIVPLIIFVFPKYVVFPHSLLTVCFFIASLVIAFLLSYVFQILVGMVSFWLGENSALHQLHRILEDTFSGRIAPLAFFPVYLQLFAGYSPFKYLIYFPSQIYLQKITIQETLLNFAVALGWVVVLYGIAYLVWLRGLRRYDGAGV